MIITPRSARARDGLAFRGDLILHPIDWRRELRDYGRAQLRLGRSSFSPHRIKRELAHYRPPCIDIEHRDGVCPLGLAHDTDDAVRRNTVVDAFYAAIIDHLAGDDTISLESTYVAAGTDGSATTGGMTSLGSEEYRDMWTAQEEQNSTALINYFFFSTAVANHYLHEFAAFAGAATGTADSGTMVGRWLYDFDKDNTKTLNGQYIIGKA